jgi:hypothetical protein
VSLASGQTGSSPARQPLAVTPLPLSAQNAYAQLIDAALGADHLRSVSDLSGSFASETVKGRTYWYYQCTQPSGRLTQQYVGPDNNRARALIARAREPGSFGELQPLVRAAVALGCSTILPRPAQVLRRLAEYGFFRAGGLLIGTHAFVAYAHMLGVRWGSQDRTLDSDVAHAGKSLSLALPTTLEVQTHDAIESLDRGFLPLTSLAGKTGGTFLVPREPGFRLDFLTSRHRGKDEPFVHPQLNVALQPMPYMEFSLEQVEQAVVFSARDAIVVNVPEPARYALHKLIVYGERRGSFRAKAGKDLAQAAHLLAHLWDDIPATVEAAIADLKGRGPKWNRALQVGVSALKAQYPAVSARRALVERLESGSSAR